MIYRRNQQTLLNPLQEGQEKASLGNNSAQKNIGQKNSEYRFHSHVFRMDVMIVQFGIELIEFL